MSTLRPDVACIYLVFLYTTLIWGLGPWREKRCVCATHSDLDGWPHPHPLMQYVKTWPKNGL